MPKNSIKISMMFLSLIGLVIVLVTSMFAWILNQEKLNDVVITFDSLTLSLNAKDGQNQSVTEIDINDLLYIDLNDIDDSKATFLEDVSKKYIVEVNTSSEGCVSDLTIELSSDDLNGLLMIIVDDSSSLIEQLKELKVSLNTINTIDEIRNECNKLNSKTISNLSPNSSLTYQLFFIGFYPSLTDNIYRDDNVFHAYTCMLTFSLTQVKEEA